jgi:hypothetical protein
MSLTKLLGKGEFLEWRTERPGEEMKKSENPKGSGAGLASSQSAKEREGFGGKRGEGEGRKRSAGAGSVENNEEN